MSGPRGEPRLLADTVDRAARDLDHCDRLLESFLALARAHNGRVSQDQVALELPLTQAA